VPKALSLFSGAGGMDIGVERAGFEIVGSVEIDANAREALHLNRPHWRSLGDGDVLSVAKTLRPIDLSISHGELDLLVGGPPCQPFSAAAQWSGGRQGMADVRARTVHGTLDLIESFLPKTVILENVSGFVSGRAAALPTIEKHLAALRERVGIGYSINYRIVNAADHGVPQNRRRVIIALVRDDQSAWQWPEPTHADSPVTAWDALHDVDETNPPAIQGKWTPLLPSIPEGWNYQWHTAHGGGVELFGYRTKYWNFLLKLAKNRPSWTLAASPGPSTGPFHWDNRPLSPREMMRIQTFPDDWTLPGDYRGQVKLIGNAMPSLLSEIMASAARRSISGDQRIQAPTLGIARSVVPSVETTTRELPEEFAHLLGKKEQHPGTGLGPGAVARREAAKALAEQTETSA
jgi:DNA (cytosine-5)-methyltransferase 1